jgi:iron(III) transport system permease protein
MTRIGTGTGKSEPFRSGNTCVQPLHVPVRDELWRWLQRLFFCFLFLVVGLPLTLPMVECLVHLPQVWSWTEIERLATLGKTTVLVAGGVLVVGLLSGIILAILLFRTDLPLRQFLAAIMLIAAFVPLPVLASVWQATLGPGGWLNLPLWPFRPGQPWTEGIVPAIWVHSMAALPWVILIVGQNLLSSERDLEEQALLSSAGWRVVMAVTLPRSWGGVALAALWVVIQVTGEITVTDMFVVRTFAEEIYRLFSEAGAEAAAQAMLVSLPALVLFWLLLGLALKRIAANIPPITRVQHPPLIFRLGPWRWFALAVAVVAALLLVGVPLIALVWRSGLLSSNSPWSVSCLQKELFRTWVVDGGKVYLTLVWALLTAVITCTVALLICTCLRSASGKPLVVGGIWAMLAAAWAIPGPVLGLGLKRTIFGLIEVVPGPIVAEVLYYGVSPVPIMWAWFIRTLPVAVIMLWPVIRLLPHQYVAAARIEGASPLVLLWRIFVPLCRRVLVCNVLVVLALALAETGASKLATTPGVETFTLLIFDRMHYGVAREVAALALLFLLLISLAAAEITLRALLLRTGRRILPGAGPPGNPPGRWQRPLP